MNKIDTIVGAKYTIKLIKVKDIVGALDKLPDMQIVRGSVWARGVAEQYAADIKAGLFSPCIVLAGGENPVCVDGQQRLTALAAALAAGILTGNELVPLAIDAGRTAEEAFSRLNIGVKVGASLVGAMDSGAAGDAIIRLAAMPYFSTVKWTGLQVGRTAKAAFAAAALAIFAGWDAPESSEKASSAWISANAELCDADAEAPCAAWINSLAEAVKPFVAFATIKGKGGAAARKVLASLRKKSLWMTAAGAGAEGIPAKDVLAVYARPELLIPVRQEIKARNGRIVQREATWSIGAGSSGNASEYADRLAVLRSAVGHLADPIPVGAEKVAAEDVSAVPGAELLGALGLDGKA